jgi:hypothetical protein
MAKKYKLGAVAGLAVLMVVVLLAGQALAQTGTPTPSGMMGGNTGMMGGNAGVTSAGTVTPTVPGRNMMSGAGGGMMGSSTGITGTQPYSAYGYGMMGGTQGVPYGMMGGNAMMGTSAGWSDPNAKPLTLDQAQAAAQKYLQGLPNNAGASLAPMEVMEFSNGFYVAVGDKTANSGALELLVDRYDGTVSPEPGPNMMWNTKYGMMSGQQGGIMGGMASMMGGMGLWTPSAGTPTVNPDAARTYAQQFLAIKFPGAKLPADMMTFPGYYTLDFEVNDLPAGMLSVNAYTGQVWYHTWHGQFLSERSMQAGS